MMTHDELRQWLDFDFTQRSIIASALAAHELHSAATLNAQREFRVELLAAAGIRPALPRGTVLAQGGTLAVDILPEQGEIRVVLQLRGFGILREFANAPARLVSGNGTIDYQLTFSTSGSAVAILDDNLSVREGLSSFSVFAYSPGQEV